MSSGVSLCGGVGTHCQAPESRQALPCLCRRPAFRGPGATCSLVLFASCGPGDKVEVVGSLRGTAERREEGGLRHTGSYVPSVSRERKQALRSYEAVGLGPGQALAASQGRLLLG